MTKSRTARWTALALFPALAAPAAAQGVTAEAAVEAQQAELRSAIRLECPPRTDEEEIVVCGSREEDSRQRLPLPVAPTPGAADRAGGEQRAAMAANDARCTPVGRAQQCNGGLNMIGIGFAIARAITQAIANRD